METTLLPSQRYSWSCLYFLSVSGGQSFQRQSEVGEHSSGVEV